MKIYISLILILIFDFVNANDSLFYRKHNFYVSFYPVLNKKPKMVSEFSGNNEFSFKSRVSTHLSFQYIYNLNQHWGLMTGIDVIGATNRRIRFDYQMDKSDYYSYFDIPEAQEINELYLKNYWWLSVNDAFALNLGALYRYKLNSKIDINLNTGFKLYMVGKSSSNSFDSYDSPLENVKKVFSLEINSIDNGRENALLNYILGAYCSIGFNHKATKIGYFNYHFTINAPFKNYYQSKIILYPQSSLQTTASFKLSLVTYGFGVNYIFQGRKQ